MPEMPKDASAEVVKSQMEATKVSSTTLSAQGQAAYEKAKAALQHGNSVSKAPASQTMPGQTQPPAPHPTSSAAREAAAQQAAAQKTSGPAPQPTSPAAPRAAAPAPRASAPAPQPAPQPSAPASSGAAYPIRKKSKAPIFIGIAAAVVVLAIVGVFVFKKISANSALKNQLALGDKYITDLDYENALLAYDKVLEMDPNNEAAYLGIAKALQGLAAKSEAAEEYETAIDYDGTGETRMKEGLKRINSNKIKKCRDDFVTDAERIRGILKRIAEEEEAKKLAEAEKNKPKEEPKSEEPKEEEPKEEEPKEEKPKEEQKPKEEKPKE